MKTKILSATKVESEIRREMKSVLDEGKTLSAFIGNAHCEAHYQNTARKTGRTVSVNFVIAELDKMIDAKFGPGSSRKKAAKA